MNKLQTFALASALSLYGAAAAVSAADYGTSPSADTGSSGMASETFQGKHTMTGTVSQLDQSTGKLTLDTETGQLKLHFPPSSLQRVKEGDQITVQLAFEEGVGRQGISGSSGGSGMGNSSEAPAGSTSQTGDTDTTSGSSSGAMQ